MGKYTSWEIVVGRYQSARTGIDAAYANSYFVTGAEAELDGYLAARYSLPMTPVPALLTDLATDMAYYKIIYADKRGEQLKKYIDARIKGILDGTLVLVSSDAPLAQTGLETSLTHDRPSSFGPDSDLCWTPSSSWAEEFQEDRLR